MYKHLTQGERYQIAVLLKAGKRQNEIAVLMNRHQSSISRECTRNRGQRAGGTLHRALRYQVSIDLRPDIANRRERFGDREADLVIGAGHQQAIVTINERTSRYALSAHVPAKTGQNGSDAMVMQRLNHRPRKCLGFRTPHECVYGTVTLAS